MEQGGRPYAVCKKTLRAQSSPCCQAASADGLATVRRGGAPQAQRLQAQGLPVLRFVPTVPNCEKLVPATEVSAVEPVAP